MRRSSLIILIGAVMAGPSAASAALISHWALDDGQLDPNTPTATDSVSPSADGTWQNVTPPRWATGLSGGAAEFGGTSSSSDRDDVISVLSGGSKLDITGALTIAAWVNYEDFGSPSSTRHIAGKDMAGGQTGDAYALKHNMSGSADTVQFLIDDPTDGNANVTSTQFLSDYTTASVNKGNGGWVHVVGVFEPDEYMKLYIDGVFDNDAEPENVPSAIALESGTDFTIGRLAGSTSHSFNGRIDDVQVYGQALNAGQVAFLYANPGVAVPEPASIALFLLGSLGLLWRRSRHS